METAIRPRVRREQKRRTRRKLFVCVLLWFLLILNVGFLFVLHRKMKNMNDMLDWATARLSILSETEKQANVAPMEYHPEGNLPEQADGELDYPEIWGLDRVDAPIKRTEREVLERLAQMSEDSDIIRKIYENRRKYPEKMVEALANNPEMAGFVAGYLDADMRAKGTGLTDSERQKEFPLFLQWDTRWGYQEYGDGSNVGISGCGPTCVSMVLYYLTGDESLTPDRIADYSMKNGYYVSGTGTAWALLEDVPAMYGINVVQKQVREENMKSALDDGAVLICSMSPGDFTAAGHFIVIYGYDREGFLVNDPNCVARSREVWNYERLERQIKNLWIYYGDGSSTRVMYYDSAL